MDEQQDINDQMLIAAIRRRLLEEIQGGGGGASQIVNNVYGSSPVGSNGITEGLAAGGGGDSEDAYDYFVDINRRDALDPEDPERKIGWDKQVHRYRKKKDQGL